MKRISECIYKAKYDKIIKLINEGYYVASDLKNALKHNLISHIYETTIYVDHRNRKIDIYGGYFTYAPFPCIMKDMTPSIPPFHGTYREICYYLYGS